MWPPKFLTVAMLEATMDQLSRIAPDLFTRVQLPNPSLLDRRKIHAIRMAHGGGASRRGFLMLGGVHGRELMNPDAIVELLSDLLVAYRNRESLSYGSRTWTWFELASIIHTIDIWAIPCANPDGRHRSMTVDWMWRKNARDTVDSTSCAHYYDTRDRDGVDIGRNFDIAWGVTGPNTSCDACSDTYVGTSPHSEPESANIVAFCATHRIDTFVDVHSYSNWVLYPWGHAITQTTDPAKAFTALNPEPCKPLTPATHREYMRGKDLLRFQTVTQRVLDSIHKVRPQGSQQTWTPKPIYDVYRGTTSGTATDYIYSRHLADPAQRKVYAFALETGPNLGQYQIRESFQPPNDTERSLIKQETKAALLTLMEQTVCGIDYIGTTIIDRPEIVEAMADLRDDSMAGTEPGREWIDLFERVQGALLAAVLSDDSVMKEAVGLFELGATLVEDDSAKLTAADIARARAFLRASVELVPTELRRDIEAIGALLSETEGQTLAQLVDGLSRNGPRGWSPGKASRRQQRGDPGWS